jgi:spore germination protein
VNKAITTAGISLLSMATLATVTLPAAPSSEAATYRTQTKSIYVNGKLLIRPQGIVSNGTTYVPIWYIIQVLNQLDIKNSWDGTRLMWTIAAPSYMPVDLTNIPKTHGSCIITLNNETVYRVNRIVYAAPGSRIPTTYMPIWYVMQLLNRLGIGSTWNGSTWRITTPPPMSVTVADPSQYPTLRYGNNGYPVVLLQQKLNAAGFNVGAIDGQFGYATQVAVKTFQRANGIPADGVAGQQTWLALNQRLATLFTQSPSVSTGTNTNTNTNTNTTDTNTGVSQPEVAPSTNNKSVMAWASTGNSLTDAMRNSTITQINHFNYNLNPDGTVTASNYGLDTLSAFLSNSASNKVDVFATVTNISPTCGNFDGTYTSRVLNDSTARSTLEKNLVDIAVQHGYKGIDVDFEKVKPTDTDIFIQFLSELANQLHAVNKELSVAVPAETGATSEPWNGAYNYAVIGNIADIIPVMAYDFSWQGSSTPGAIAPLYWDEQILRYATSVMPKSKILLGLPAYGYDWNTTTGGYATAYSLNKIDALIAQFNVTPCWDSTDAVPYFTYSDASGNCHTVYYENTASIQQKLNLASQYGLAGVAIWKAGLENQAFWQAVQPWAQQNAN